MKVFFCMQKSFLLSVKSFMKYFVLNNWSSLVSRFYSDGKRQKETSWGKNDPSFLEKSSSGYMISFSSVLKPENGMVGGRNRLPEMGKIGR